MLIATAAYASANTAEENQLAFSASAEYFARTGTSVDDIASFSSCADDEQAVSSCAGEWACRTAS
jgi:hypothetical protein